MLMLAALFATALAQSVVTEQQVATLSFTGDVEVDFGSKAGVITVIDPPGTPEVGLPPGPAWANVISGWAIKDHRFSYNYRTDELFFGINCYGICGDADGDGDPGHTSAALAANGGVDLPNFQQSESVALGVDLSDGNGGGPDGQMDVVLGYPSSTPSDSEPFPCGSTLYDTSCFALYIWDGTGFDKANTRFKYQSTSAVCQHQVTDHNVPTSKAHPDLEWSIPQWTALQTALNGAVTDVNGKKSFSINVLSFSGSFQDDGIGEDNFPATSNFQTIVFPCITVDVCDVCGGSGTTCLDCKGIANGPNTYDVCDICGGNGQSCADCKGVAFGSATYDSCDVCDGDGSSCKDCKGVTLGTTTYDVCDVCGGDGSTCAPIKCESSQSASEPLPVTPLTMKALKRRLDAQKHHRDVLKWKIDVLQKCLHSSTSDSSSTWSSSSTDERHHEEVNQWNSFDNHDDDDDNSYRGKYYRHSASDSEHSEAKRYYDDHDRRHRRHSDSDDDDDDDDDDHHRRHSDSRSGDDDHHRRHSDSRSGDDDHHRRHSDSRSGDDDHHRRRHHSDSHSDYRSGESRKRNVAEQSHVRVPFTSDSHRCAERRNEFKLKALEVDKLLWETWNEIKAREAQPCIASSSSSSSFGSDDEDDDDAWHDNRFQKASDYIAGVNLPNVAGYDPRAGGDDSRGRKSRYDGDDPTRPTAPPQDGGVVWRK